MDEPPAFPPPVSLQRLWREQGPLEAQLMVPSVTSVVAKPRGNGARPRARSRPAPAHGAAGGAPRGAVPRPGGERRRCGGADPAARAPPEPPPAESGSGGSPGPASCPPEAPGTRQDGPGRVTAEGEPRRRPGGAGAPRRHQAAGAGASAEPPAPGAGPVLPRRGKGGPGAVLGPSPRARLPAVGAARAGLPGGGVRLGRGGRQGALCPFGRAGSDGAHAGAETRGGDGEAGARGPGPSLLRRLGGPGRGRGSGPLRLRGGHGRRGRRPPSVPPSLRGRRSRSGRARLSLYSFVRLSGRASFVFCRGASPAPRAPGPAPPLVTLLSNNFHVQFHFFSSSEISEPSARRIVHMKTNYTKSIFNHSAAS